MIQKIDGLRNRVLFIEMPNIAEDKELYEIRSYLVENQSEYLDMWKDYEK